MTTATQPSAADLDAVAAEAQVRQVTTPTADYIKAAAIAKLEADAKEWDRLSALEDQAKADKAALKPSIMFALKTFGSVPDSAPKSRRVETEGFVCTLTTGTTMEVDDDAVFNLEQLLRRSKRMRELFALMFRKRSEYTLEPTAQQTILHTKWPAAIREQVRDAYMRCMSAKTTAPSLSIESKAEIAERQRKAQEEAAAKALAAASKRAGKKAA